MFGLKFPTDTPAHAPSYYAATTNTSTAYPPLTEDTRADVAIVGGGFSGVNTALELTERGYKVVLLEANRLSWGASGRNGGQAIGGIGHHPEQFRNTIGDEGVRAIHSMGDECIEIIRERVATYNIECDLRWGYCDVALKPRHLRWFERSRREALDRGYAHSLRLLDKSELKEFVGSDAYLGGLYNEHGSGHLHPMNLCLGEAAAAQAQGAIIHEASRVLQVKYGTQIVLRAANACVTADHVVFCGNAYMEGLVPQLSTRVLPASSCIVATEPMPTALAHSVLPRNIAVSDPRTALDYFRLTSDNRLLFGGLCNYTGLVPNNYVTIMRGKMLKIFPQLEDVKIEYAWDGQLGIGLNRMPQVGKLADNSFYMQAYAGHGVGPTHLMARITAESISGESNRIDVFSKIRHRPFPGGRSLRRPGFALGMLYFKALDLF